jgi:hypothetical protein
MEGVEIIACLPTGRDKCSIEPLQQQCLNERGRPLNFVLQLTIRRLADPIAAPTASKKAR